MRTINSVYIHNFLNGIADSIVKIFVPVLILQYMESLIWAIAYIAIYCFANLFLSVILNKLILKYNITSLIIHILFFLLTPILIAFCQFNIALIIVLAISGGFGQALYYTPVENLYTYSSNQPNMARYDAFCSLGYFIFSLASAFILSSTLNNSLLFVCISASLVYIASLIPFFIKKEQVPKFKIKKIKKYPKHKFYKIFFLFWMFSAVGYTITNMVIPVYIFNINPSIELIGIVLAATYLIEIGIDYICRYLRVNNFQILSIAIYFVLFTISIVLILLFPNNIVLVVASTVGSLAYLFSYITMQDYYFTELKKDGYAPAGIMYKNIACSIMRVIVLSLYFIFPSFLTIFIGGIVCAFMALILTILLMKTHKEKEINKSLSGLKY